MINIIKNNKSGINEKELLSFTKSVYYLGKIKVLYII